MCRYCASLWPHLKSFTAETRAVSRFNLISEGASNVVGVDTVWDEWVENICIPKVPKQSQLWEHLSKSPTAPPNSLLLPNQHSVHGPRSLVPMWTSCPQPLFTLLLLLCLISNLWKKSLLRVWKGEDKIHDRKYGVSCHCTASTLSLDLYFTVPLLIRVCYAW